MTEQKKGKRVHLTDEAHAQAMQGSAAADKSMKEWVSQLIRDAVNNQKASK